MGTAAATPSVPLISVCLKMVDTSKIAIFTRKVIAVLGITRIIELIIQ